MSSSATVVSLDSHPVRESARTRSEEYRAAMRRHPSYIAAAARAEADPAVVRRLR